MKPLKVHGSSLACMVAVEAALRNGREVEWDYTPPVAQPFGEWAPFGMVLLELDHEEAPDEAPPLAEYQPGGRGHVPYLPLIREWVEGVAGWIDGWEVEEIDPAPEMWWNGRYITDRFLTPVGWTEAMRWDFAAKLRGPLSLNGVPLDLYRRLWVPRGTPRNPRRKFCYGMREVMANLWKRAEIAPSRFDPTDADIVSPVMSWMPRRLPITATLVAIEEPARDISVVHIPDPEIPAHRITRYDEAGVSLYSVEHRPGADPLAVLEVMGILEPAGEAIRLSRATHSIVDPTAETVRLWEEARARIDLPGIIVGPCAAFGADSFNEQVVQGLAAEEATR